MKAGIATLIAIGLSAGGIHAQVEVDVLTSTEITSTFGRNVALDGDVAVVSATFENLVSILLSDEVEIYERQGDTWQAVQLIADPEGGGGIFGASFDVADDLLVVGAPGFGQPVAGGVYVFERGAAGWELQDTLTSSSLTLRLGRRVVLDGDRIVAADSLGPFLGGASSGGTVAVFERDAGVWNETHFIDASDGQFNNFFGEALDLDGDTLVVGAPRAGFASGAAYVYDISVSPATEIIIPSPSQVLGSEFGKVVAIDGNWLFATETVPSAVVHVFENTAGSWTLVDTLEPQDFDCDFGADLAVSDGRLFVSGGDLNCGGLFPDAVGFSVYELANGTWAFKRKVLVEDGSGLGRALAVDGDTVFFGQPVANGSTGAVRVFDISKLDDTLVVSDTELSLSSGESIKLDAAFGDDNAGAVHIIVGSASGTFPGTTVLGVPVPLNVDAYFRASLDMSAGLAAPSIFLDVFGQGEATFTLPPNLPSSLIGLTLNHAVLRLDAGQLVEVSDPVAFTLVP